MLEHCFICQLPVASSLTLPACTAMEDSLPGLPWCRRMPKCRRACWTYHQLGLTKTFVLHGESSKRLAPPRNTEDRKHLQSTQPSVTRHTAQTKHQALSKGQPGRRITPKNTAAVHALAQEPAIITRTQQGHHQILSATAVSCEAKEQYIGGLSRATLQAPPTSAGTRTAPPRLGGLSSGVADGQPRAHGLLLSKGRGRGEGGGRGGRGGGEGFGGGDMSTRYGVL